MRLKSGDLVVFSDSLKREYPMELMRLVRSLGEPPYRVTKIDGDMLILSSQDESSAEVLNSRWVSLSGAPASYPSSRVTSSDVQRGKKIRIKKKRK